MTEIQNDINFQSGLAYSPIAVEATNQCQFICQIIAEKADNQGNLGPFPGFFLKFNEIIWLIANSHLISEKEISEGKNIQVNFYSGQEIKSLFIQLDRKARKIFSSSSKSQNITIVQMTENDCLFPFLEPDVIKNENGEFEANIKPGDEVIIYQYQNGQTFPKEGQIGDIKGYILNYTVSIEKGSPGTPVINKMNNKVCGVHCEREELVNNTIGTSILEIIKLTKLNYQETNHYKGYFNKEGKHEGLGTYKFDNGEIYEGEWENGNFKKGKYSYSNGTYYDGDWVDNKRDGYGIKGNTHNGMKTFEGEWKNNKRIGEGKEWYDNGEIYEGNFVDNVKQGEGTYWFIGGKYYKGHWENGTREGKGALYIKVNDQDKLLYEGDWLKGKRTGKGKEYYDDGTYYEGDFVNDSREGFGKRTYINGECYEGQFVNGKKQGQGKYFWQNGDYYEGTWEDNTRQGPGKYYYQNGTVVDQNYENGHLSK